jgi:hypothetical protein
MSDDTPDAEGEDKVRPAALRKRELIDAVTGSSGVKRQAVQSVVDAVLAEIATALAAGNALILPPLGRIGINRTKSNDKADVLILKLTRSKGEPKKAKVGGPRKKKQRAKARANNV